MQKPLIENFETYREFIVARFAWLKDTQKYSHRIFSKRAGFTSHNYLKLVVEGKRNLTATSAYKFAKGLQLDADEAQKFVIMVFTIQESAFHQGWKDALVASLTKH